MGIINVVTCCELEEFSYSKWHILIIHKGTLHMQVNWRWRPSLQCHYCYIFLVYCSISFQWPQNSEKELSTSMIWWNFLLKMDAATPCVMIRLNYIYIYIHTQRMLTLLKPIIITQFETCDFITKKKKLHLHSHNLYILSSTLLLN